MMKYFVLLLVTLLLFACANHPDLVPEEEMVGKWNCVKIEQGEQDAPLRSIVFEFGADSTYHYYSEKNPNGGQKGAWYTLEDKLYTTPENGKLMAVKLGRSGNDTLRFYQIRGGYPEIWTMVRAL